MKYLTILTLSIFSIISYSQDYKTEVLFDAMTGKSSNKVPIKVEGDGCLLEVDFTSMDCSTLQFRVGYALQDMRPAFLDTIPGLNLPITLDKTKYTETYRGITSNVLSLDILKHNGNHYWFEVINPGTCNSGEVILRHN